MAAFPDSIPVDKVESLLCCSICLERVQDPRTLPCFHSYCKHCLENYVSKKRKKVAKGKKKIEEFECPSCRSLFPLKDHEEVCNIRGSHFIRNMVDVLNALGETNVWKCSNHSEKPSCCRCVSCEIFLCEECLKMHENWSTFKGHLVLTNVELKKTENQSKITGQMRCKEHASKKLKFYCDSCQELICRYCMDFNHVRPDHVCHPIEKIVEKHRKALQGCCDKIDEKQAEGEESLKHLAEEEKTIKEIAEKAKGDISKQKDDIVKAVEIAFQEKIDGVDRLYAINKELLARKTSKVKSFLDKVKCTSSMSKNVLQKGSNEEIIESHKMVEERVKMVNNETEEVKDTQKVFNVNKYWYAANQVDPEVISSLFGQVLQEILFCSSILEKAEHIEQITNWLGSKDDPYLLCYRASTDGWSANDFHTKCDDKGLTLVLVKVDDYIFGGYMDVGWVKGKDRVYSSENAFLFSLKNRDNLPPFKAPVLLKQNAVTFNSGLGPLFGKGNYSNGHDLFISKNPQTEKCYTDFGKAYQLPYGYVHGKTEARCLLAGSFNFTPSEIEVFCHKEN